MCGVVAVFACLLCALCQAGSAKTDNLVKNPGFEEGKDVPVGWTKPDNLTVFWEAKGGVKGNGLRFDTDVYRKEWEAHKDAPDAKVEKTETEGTKYNTVGGTAGVAVYSEPIPVEKDAWYLFEYDVKGPGGEPFIFLNGYWVATEEAVAKSGTKIFFKPFPNGPSFSLVAMGSSGEEKRPPVVGDYIMAFRRRFVVKLGEAPKSEKGDWRRYSGVVHFEKRFNVELVLLELYAYWPPGNYFFDNILMRKVTEAEAQQVLDEKKKMGKAANCGTRVGK
ncbi:MAG: hypothetical protein A3K19_05115 [Lentisphaerae bacterium RIFOXYB12_FULL_65_16]|nr:MAG: hypothetical protein A3K18_35235 [Lentisphaerae bacterium RIFOXYA12_64_32]OGV89768.1 MAG: hypothetical protein A3K19_05115 [Lentisphaerae bacterium RIFOXYB12_FULL_65_16]